MVDGGGGGGMYFFFGGDSVVLIGVDRDQGALQQVGVRTTSA